jgi:hypothetical protein
MNNYLVYDSSDNYIYVGEDTLAIKFLDNDDDDTFASNLDNMRSALRVFESPNGIRRLSFDVSIDEYDIHKSWRVNDLVVTTIAQFNCTIEYLRLDMDWMMRDDNPFTQLMNAILSKRLKSMIFKTNPLAIEILLPICTTPNNQLTYLNTDVYYTINPMVWHDILTNPNNKITKLIIKHCISGYSIVPDIFENPNCRLKYISLKYYDQASVDKINKIISSLNNPTSRIETFNINNLDTETINGIMPYLNNFDNNVCLQQFGPIKLERNITIQNIVTRVALTLIAIRKFRSGDSGLLGLVPKEIVKLITRYLLSTYREPVWLSVVPP